MSIKSEKHEYVHSQYDMLKDETEHHNDARKYRRTRRNRKRYRKPRFDNRSKQNKDMAPSLRHRVENQVNLFNAFCKVMPITQASFEMGKFDTQLLQAIADGKPLPEGKDYQHGSEYLFETERAAVFFRDHYTCQICKKSVKDGVILHTHHIGFWKGYRSNWISNLLTVCEKCHTAKNHKQGGKLWGLEPKSANLVPATYMNTVRWVMYQRLVLSHPEVDIHIQYGAKTAVTRRRLHIPKYINGRNVHANDAYCIGEFHPKHRCHEMIFAKCRRNNRILSKFYDAKYIDIRDGQKKSGSQLSCGRTNRRESRNSEKNERIYRRSKVSAGRVSVRQRHYPLQPGDTVVFQNHVAAVKGTHCRGKHVMLENGKSVSINKIVPLVKIGGYRHIGVIESVAIPPTAKAVGFLA